MSDSTYSNNSELPKKEPSGMIVGVTGQQILQPDKKVPGRTHSSPAALPSQTEPTKIGGKRKSKKRSSKKKRRARKSKKNKK